MKIAACFFIALTWGMLTTHAQQYEAVAAKSKADLTRKKGAALLNASAAKSTREIMERKVTYSGFFVEMTKSDKPLHLTELRSPVNAKRDSENVILEPKTGRVWAWKLFSLDF